MKSDPRIHLGHTQLREFIRQPIIGKSSLASHVATLIVNRTRLPDFFTFLFYPYINLRSQNLQLRSIGFEFIKI